MTYAEWGATCRYRIVKSPANDWHNTTIVATGLTWDEAKKEEARLQSEYDKDNPGKSSWSKDLFHSEMETPKWGAA